MGPHKCLACGADVAIIECSKNSGTILACRTQAQLKTKEVQLVFNSIQLKVFLVFMSAAPHKQSRCSSFTIESSGKTGANWAMDSKQENVTK